MKEYKKKRVTFILVVELLLFIYGYCFGSRGLLILHAQHQKNSALALQVAQARQEHVSLEKELFAWQSNPLYKERYAREVLQMAKADELVYYLEK